MNCEKPDEEFLGGLEEAVRDELIEVDVSQAEYVLSLPVSEWPFDPTEAGLLTVRLGSLLGAVEALRSLHPSGTSTPDAPKTDPPSVPIADSALTSPRDPPPDEPSTSSRRA